CAASRRRDACLPGLLGGGLGITARQTWMAARQTWMAARQTWMAARQTWMAARQTWMATRPTWMATRRTWMAARQTWMAARQTWMAARRTLKGFGIFVPLGLSGPADATLKGSRYGQTVLGARAPRPGPRDADDRQRHQHLNDREV